MPTANENIAGDESLAAGLYTFEGLYIPGSSEWTAKPVAVSPFTLENALQYAGEPGNYLIVLEEDAELPVMVRLNIPGLCLVLKGRGGQRRISRSPGAADSGVLFEVEYSVLALGYGIALEGSEEYTAPVISVGKRGSLELHRGARISGGRASGVALGTVAASGAVFTMYNGEISGCVTGGAGGGAVNIENGASFTMKGGVIQGNKVLAVSTAGNAGGGGVRCGNGRFVMECGEIRGNTSPAGGGGVSGPFTMRGGRITDNHGANDLLLKNITHTPAMGGKDGGQIEDWTTVFGVSITTAQNTLVNRGRTLAIRAQVVGIGGQDPALHWTIEGEHHRYTTVDSGGLLSVAAGEQAYSLLLRAASAAAPDQTAEITVQIAHY
jgi:hypothetical protein